MEYVWKSLSQWSCETMTWIEIQTDKQPEEINSVVILQHRKEETKSNNIQRYLSLAL